MNWVTNWHEDHSIEIPDINLFRNNSINNENDDYKDDGDPSLDVRYLSTPDYSNVHRNIMSSQLEKIYSKTINCEGVNSNSFLTNMNTIENILRNDVDTTFSLNTSRYTTIEIDPLSFHKNLLKRFDDNPDIAIQRLTELFSKTTIDRHIKDVELKQIKEVHHY